MLSDLKNNITILYKAAFDPRSPWHLKILLILIVAYIASPIDLIPDFIPVIGFLDEAVLVPILLRYAFRLIPDDLRLEFQQQLDSEEDKPNKGLKSLGGLLVIMIWILLALLFSSLLYYFW